MNTVSFQLREAEMPLEPRRTMLRKTKMPLELSRAMANLTSLVSFLRAMSIEREFMSTLRDADRSLNDGRKSK